MFQLLRDVVIQVLLWSLGMGCINEDECRRLISASPLPPGEGQGEGIKNEIVGKDVAPTGYRC